MTQQIIEAGAGEGKPSPISTQLKKGVYYIDTQGHLLKNKSKARLDFLYCSKCDKFKQKKDMTRYQVVFEGGQLLKRPLLSQSKDAVEERTRRREERRHLQRLEAEEKWNRQLIRRYAGHNSREVPSYRFYSGFDNNGNEGKN
jgi:hypothetical protein